MLKKRKISERKFIILSCGSYLLGIICMTIFGYFYDKLPYKDILYIIPICLLLLGAIFSGMLNIQYPILGESEQLFREEKDKK